jgi:TatD DNase family protein
MIPFVDIHTHFPKPSENVITVQNFSQNEWEKDSFTEGEHLASVGLHPWFLTKENAENDLIKLTQLIDNQNIVAIGECGLDKLRGESMAFQTTVFTKQIQLAESIQKPIIIHCVRAFNEVIALKKRLKPTVPMIIHGFNKGETVLQELLKHGFYISIGAAILRSRPDSSGRGDKKFNHTLLQIPKERLFFETDDVDMDIRLVYDAYCEIAEMDLNDLKSIIYQSIFSKTGTK